MAEQKQRHLLKFGSSFDIAESAVQVHKQLAHSDRGRTFGVVGAASVVGENRIAALDEIRDCGNIVVGAGVQTVSNDDQPICIFAGIVVTLQLDVAYGIHKFFSFENAAHQRVVVHARITSVVGAFVAREE